MNSINTGRSILRSMPLFAMLIGSLTGTLAYAEQGEGVPTDGQAAPVVEFAPNVINLGAKLKYNLTTQGSALESHESVAYLQLRLKAGSDVRIVKCENAQATRVESMSGEKMLPLPADSKQFVHDWARLHLEEAGQLRLRQEYKENRTFKQYPMIQLPIPHEGDISTLLVHGDVQMTYADTPPVPLKLTLTPDIYGKRLRIEQIPDFFLLIHPPRSDFTGWRLEVEVPANLHHHIWGIRFLDAQGQPLEYVPSQTDFPDREKQTRSWYFNVRINKSACEAIELQLLPELISRRLPFAFDRLTLQPTNTKWDEPFQPQREEPTKIPVEIQLKSTPPAVDGKAVTQRVVESNNLGSES